MHNLGLYYRILGNFCIKYKRSRSHRRQSCYLDAIALLEVQRNLENVISILFYQKYETY